MSPNSEAKRSVDPHDRRREGHPATVQRGGQRTRPFSPPTSFTAYPHGRPGRVPRRGPAPMPPDVPRRTDTAWLRLEVTRRSWFMRAARGARGTKAKVRIDAEGRKSTNVDQLVRGIDTT